MRTVLITGANGEIGHGLINRLAELANTRIVALDLNAADESLRKKQVSVGGLPWAYELTRT